MAIPASEAERNELVAFNHLERRLVDAAKECAKHIRVTGGQHEAIADAGWKVRLAVKEFGEAYRHDIRHR